MKAALMRQIGTSLISDPDAIPLKFYHKSLHSAHELQPYPRLMIHKPLAGPGPSDISAATLWLWAPVSCEITLDSTPDHGFTLASRASHDQLKEVIDELKDR
ncbi:hypothetical protein FJTKL_15124 [Diaporthe vaccinii]|uniref:Uncharacterized protein n=1 Tax=Diaporthe vaccinii TaxID=105482 RepID=A0ABR4E5W5_9PEZI